MRGEYHRRAPSLKKWEEEGGKCVSTVSFSTQRLRTLHRKLLYVGSPSLEMHALRTRRNGIVECECMCGICECVFVFLVLFVSSKDVCSWEEGKT